MLVLLLRATMFVLVIQRVLFLVGYSVTEIYHPHLSEICSEYRHDSSSNWLFLQKSLRLNKLTKLQTFVACISVYFKKIKITKMFNQ